MLFNDVYIGGFRYVLPETVWSSEWMEGQMKDLYERLKLPEGRLELMTGIKERRFWTDRRTPSKIAAEAGEKVFEAGEFRKEDVDLLIFTGVCRDRLEPATAAYVHQLLGLPSYTGIFDLSNACLGFLNGITVAGGMISSGQIRSALVVTGETGYSLVENTLRTLVETVQTRETIKPYFANLTIGSGGAAAVVTHKGLAGEGFAKLTGGTVLTDSGANQLCQGGGNATESLVMQTDSEGLLQAGVALAKKAWGRFCERTGWVSDTPNVVITHQVGQRHQRELYKAIGVDMGKDFSTYEFLGNTGSASIPITLGMALERGRIERDDLVALLGIGSGLSCLMLGLEF